MTVGPADAAFKTAAAVEFSLSVGRSGIATSIEHGRPAIRLCPSRTRTWNSVLAAAIGVPVTDPLADSVKPAGKVPVKAKT